MQLNPIFFSTGSDVAVTSEGDAQTLKETKYLFSDLVKVEEKFNSNENKYPEYFNEPGISLINQNSESKIELEFDDSENAQNFSFLIDKSNPSVFALLNSVYNFADPTVDIPINFNSSANVQNSINEVEIKNVDLEMLKDFLIDMKFNSSENPVAITKLGNNITEQTNNLKGEIITSENSKQIFSSIEEVIKLLENNSKVSFELFKSANNNSLNAVPFSKMKSESSDIIAEIVKEKFVKPQSNNLENSLLQLDRKGEMRETINFRTGSSTDQVVKLYTQKLNGVSKNSSESFLKSPKIFPGNGSKYFVEINKNENFTGFGEELNLSKKQYSLRIKVLNQLTANGEKTKSHTPFLSNHSMQNLLRKNESLQRLRSELSKLFKNVDEVKLTENTFAGKDIPKLEKPVQPKIKTAQPKTELKNPVTTDEKTSTSNLAEDKLPLKDNFEVSKGLQTVKKTNEYGDKHISENQSKTVTNDSKVNQAQAQLKSDVNSNSSQKQNGEDHSQFEVFENDDANVENIKKNNPTFEFEKDQKINPGDKNLLSSTIQPKANNNIPQQKLLNNLEVFSKIADLIKKKDRRSIEIKLNPPELGKMKVKVEYGERKLMIRMEVENETAKQLLNQNIEQLKQNINQNGMQLKEIFVSLSTSDQKQQKSSSTRKREPEAGTKSIFEDPDASENVKMMGYNTYEYLI